MTDASRETVSPQARAQRLREALRESPPLLWSFLYFFCLLTGYYVLRPVREAMGASADVGAIFPPWMIDGFTAVGVPLNELVLQVLFTGTFLIMLVLQPAYGWLVSRWPRRVFLPTVYAFFIASALLFYLAFHVELPGRGMLFFFWVTVFNLFAVSVFWSFMADIYSTAEARRLYGYIGAGGTLGAFLGPVLTRLLVERIGVAQLLLISVGFLTLCIVCILRLRRYAVLRERQRHLRSGEQAIGGDVLAGLKLIVREPLMRAMAVLMVFGVGVGTLLYNEQAAIARSAFPDAESRTAFYAGIDLAVNGLTLIIQLFLTRWLLSRFGLAPVLLIPAGAILIGYCALAAAPLPLLVAVVQVMTRAGEFSLAKPGRETIYTQVEREWRYKASAAIDTVVYRGGDLCFVWLHKLLSLGGSTLVFVAGAATAAAFGWSALRLLREHARLPVRSASEG
ncbi:MAG TPA: MFS transporter [Arenimonas sp.]|nr:MFS transporter [Arenimonas sp.]